MNKKILVRNALSAATLLAAVMVSPAQASYVCTGASVSASGNPFFDGDLTDGTSVCGVAELEAALGFTIDTSLILGSKTNSVNDPITSWSQDEFGLGTLTVTTYTDTTGTWSLTGGSVTPLFFVDKYDSGYDLYTYMGPGTDPFSDSWDGSNRGTVGATCKTTGGGPPTGDVNCDATTSHISVYGGGVVPIPAAVWLFGSGLLGLIGIARRKRS